MIGHGLLQRTPSAREYTFGGISGTDKAELELSRNWLPLAPTHEIQHKGGYDTMACVSYSALNCIEILEKFQTGVEPNYSDRFTAKMSGTTKQGNYFTTVADSLRNDGLVNEAQWQGENLPTWDDYYSEIPDSVAVQATDFLSKYEVQYEHYYPDFGEGFLTGLMYGPIQVCMEYASVKENGVYKWQGGRTNHAVTLVAIDDQSRPIILDHYGEQVKVLDKGYPIPYGLLYTLTKRKIEKPMTLNENYLYQLTENVGSFGLAVGGKLIVDDVAKLMASFVVRNGGDISGRVSAIGWDDWVSVDKIDLKGAHLENDAV